jgi:hypothetical protein
MITVVSASSGTGRGHHDRHNAPPPQQRVGAATLRGGDQPVQQRPAVATHGEPDQRRAHASDEGQHCPQQRPEQGAMRNHHHARGDRQDHIGDQQANTERGRDRPWLIQQTAGIGEKRHAGGLHGGEQREEADEQGRGHGSVVTQVASSLIRPGQLLS